MNTTPSSPIVGNQVLELKQRLLARQIELESEMYVQRGEDAAVSHTNTEPGESDAVMNSSNDMEIIQYERDQTELIQVQAALTRIENGDYGICTDCGVDVGAARLQAAPHAGRCISCQEKVEQSARDHGQALHTKV